MPNKPNVTFKLRNPCLCQYYTLKNDNEREEFPSIILVTLFFYQKNLSASRTLLKSGIVYTISLESVCFSWYFVKLKYLQSSYKTNQWPHKYSPKISWQLSVWACIRCMHFKKKNYWCAIIQSCSLIISALYLNLKFWC